jgi:hypothetical protein
MADSDLQAVSMIAATLWASRGIGNRPSQEELDKVSGLAWDIFYSVKRARTEARGRAVEVRRKGRGKP